MAGELIIKNGLIISGSVIAVGGFTGSFSGAGSSNSLVTGSITASVNISPNFFLIQSGSKEILKVKNDGVLVLSTSSIAPSVETGGFFFSSSGDLYIGI